MQTHEVVRVNRTIKPNYGSLSAWDARNIRPVHPELESAGPSEYSIGDLEPRPTLERESYRDLYARFEKSGELAECLNVRDAESISNLHVSALDDLIGRNGTAIFLGSAVDSSEGKFVLTAQRAFGEVMLSWAFLDEDVVRPKSFVICFKKK